MLRGVLEVTTNDGRKRRFVPGDLVHVPDTDGLGHVTVGVGGGPFEGCSCRPRILLLLPITER